MTGTVLYDRDQVDHLDSISERPRRLRRSQLLWVDLGRDGDFRELADAFNLDQQTVDFLEAAHATPVFHDFGHYIHVTSYAAREDDESGELHAIECLVADERRIVAVARRVRT